jgi:purine-binding chemotaxis protein CheW
MMEFVIFELGTCRFGVQSSDVDEVLRAVTQVSLPRSPSIVEGIVNIRGDIVPVLNIRARFRVPPKADAITDRLIVARIDKRRIAFRVDHASELAVIADHQIEDAAVLLPNLEYVSGVAKLPDGIMLIHDLHSFLSEAEVRALAEFERGMTI